MRGTNEMKIRLIRHGMTPLGEEGRYQGSTDAGLSEKGRAALRRAEFTPAHIYVSPALRARETAQILFPDSAMIVVEDLREMDFGSFEGRGWWEMEKDTDYREWVDGGCTGLCPGGEDRDSFSRRVCAAFERILSMEETDKGAAEVTVVAHGGTQMALLERWGQPAKEYFQWQTPCGWGWLLERDPASGALRPLEKNSFLSKIEE